MMIIGSSLLPFTEKSKRTSLLEDERLQSENQIQRSELLKRDMRGLGRW
ncbi:hypothetical protein MANES_02G113950v8 [Manihot esculenta]|uniref:Uncharacterized protein n=1 Tax=Manihot esculenta TaxID=3983 RepID=A0ACB7I795_MANES|nr:hypothetical protein MANES_02G113950v8 [Manihot esculenta]